MYRTVSAHGATNVQSHKYYTGTEPLWDSLSDGACCRLLPPYTVMTATHPGQTLQLLSSTPPRGTLSGTCRWPGVEALRTNTCEGHFSVWESSPLEVPPLLHIHPDGTQPATSQGPLCRDTFS